MRDDEQGVQSQADGLVDIDAQIDGAGKTVGDCHAVGGDRAAGDDWEEMPEHPVDADQELGPTPPEHPVDAGQELWPTAPEHPVDAGQAAVPEHPIDAGQELGPGGDLASELAAAFEAAVLGEPLMVEATTIDIDDTVSMAARMINDPQPQSSLHALADIPERPVRRSPRTFDEASLEETIVSSAPQWTGEFLTVEDVTVRLPNGKSAHREIVRHPGAVGIIALTENNKLVMVHQYRTSLEQVTIEIPAGKLEPGEDPKLAAARELVEETGYEAAQLAYLGPIAMAAGYSDEILHLYMAMGLTFVGAHPDDDEFVNVDLVDLNELVDQVLDGKIVDSKTVAGILLCDAILRRM